MTREEAKRRLLNIERCTPIHTREDVRDFEALEMAIQALEQEPSVDLISRQAVLDRKYVVEVKNMWHMMEEIEVVNVDDIKALPSVKQERTGHWILDETDNSITCDKCGCLIWANDISNGEAYFCPNCGCRMVEPQERSDKE